MLISCSHPTNIPKKRKLKEEPYASYIDGFLEGWILMQAAPEFILSIFFERENDNEKGEKKTLRDTLQKESLISML